jgi:hypothetical protein
LKAWGFDTSKQGVAALVIHMLNLLFGNLLSATGPNDDECSWVVHVQAKMSRLLILLSSM